MSNNQSPCAVGPICGPGPSLKQADRKATGQAGRQADTISVHVGLHRPDACTHKLITHTTHTTVDHRYAMQHEAGTSWNGIKRAHAREGTSEVTRASPSHPSLTQSVSSSQCLQSTPPSIHPPARPATYLPIGTFTAGHTHGTHDTKTTTPPCPAQADLTLLPHPAHVPSPRPAPVCMDGYGYVHVEAGRKEDR